MKRSEMIKLITQTLDMSLKPYNGLTHKETANLLLMIIEGYDILPPEDTTETYYSGDEPGGYHPRRWEEE